jgi:amino acid adenylation domain-containing protein/non-ribosomal peptide synthase protein (TIGR01720 family)
MSRKNIENIYSLSPMQQGILFHTLYEETAGVYQVELAWTLRGRLDVPALSRAWQEVVDRHPVLRTAFVWERVEKPVQVVRKKVTIALEEVDLRDLPEPERDAAARRFQEELGKRGFDLTRAPLMRLALVRLEDEVHKLIWSSHHLLLDGWSLPLVVRDAFTLYEAHANGRTVQLDRPRPYGDYIAWLARQDLAKAEAFWRKQLQGFAAPTPFRVERLDQGAEEGFEERTQVIGINDASALQAFARAHKLTVSTLVQGAWALLLARYSGEEEIVYGSTVSGRSAPVPGIDRMVGLFINTLPVRVPVPRGMPALAWLTRVQDLQSELREYEYTPLIQVQGWSELPRGAPLFESQVAFENYPSAETLLQASGGLQVAATEMSSQAHYPLTFIAVSQRTIGLRISYDRRRFDRATVDRMLQHLATLLASIAREPDRDVWQLPMLPEPEREQLVVAWNQTTGDYQADACAHHLFERRVDQSPDALALVAKDGRLSYRELDERANRLAHHLRKLGVDRDAVVGLYLDRSVEIVIAILGILKAGGAYLPFDPSYPPQRVAQIRDDAGVRVVVSRASLAAAAEGEGIRVLQVDTDAEAIAAEPAARLEGGATPDSLVYVLFTSGSTGKPKGVAVEHRNLVNYTLGVAERLDLPEGASYAHVSTFAADVGITVLFPPLILGGTMHVIAEDLTTDPDGYGAYAVREGIDCLKLVPSHFSALLSGARPERVVPRRLLVVGGEGLRWDLVARVRGLSPGTRVLNHYSPSECTCGVLTYPVDPELPIPGLPIAPLGRPLSNSRIYILDAHLAPVPTGVPGEICIAGRGVTRGYLGRPDLTAERFVPDPFHPGERMYRSGDRGRQLADGTIVFLGRVDFQVKIRGFRIELGEIEAALHAHPALREAVVLAHDDEGGDKHLVAYLVPKLGEEVAVPTLRSYLEERLPDYMVPVAYHFLPALPLTENGKIDRKSLRSLEVLRHDHAEEEDTFVPPRNPVEEVLAGIFSDVFARERIGAHDAFADLGGHSLLAIQIIARTREAFQIEIPLRAIFESPTIALLAEDVAAALRRGEGSAAPPITRVPRDGDLALSFAQERLWFLHQLDPDSPSYNVASTLRVEGHLDVVALERALRELTRRHEILRTTYKSVDGRPVQVVDDEVRLSLAVQDLASLGADARAEAVRAEIAAEARRPFDLATGPLFRARLLSLGAEEHVLCLTLHHIVSDGWTRGILNREVSSLYRAFQAGKDHGLPELPVQYADYAAWQRKWLSGEVMDRQVAYWKQQLAGAPHVLELPTDHPRPPVMTSNGANRQRILPAAVGLALKDLARRQGVTLYMVLLSALDILLHRWTGQRDVVIGTSVSNRSRAETERLIGFFINALVLRVGVDDAAPYAELLQRVRDVCLGAYAHQDMPFERLVQELAPEPDPSRTPLFQVIFTMQTAPGESLSLSGTTARGGAREVTTAKYDLVFLAGEGRGGEIGLSIDYNTDLFDGPTIDRMIAHLGNLLGAIAENGARKVADLPMLPAEEREALLVRWNDTAASYSTDECVHELFEAQVDAHPDALAAASGAARLTYRELESRANRLAHYLRARGVGPESVVGLCHGRSLGVVVGILGILKAGGAYVPLDPAFPPQRLAQIIRESGARVVVTEEVLAASLPGSGVALLRLDGDAAALAAESDARPDSGASAANLVYVLFTSGSTGKPKGVAVEHRNLVNYTRGIAARLDLPTGATYAHVSTFSADLGNTVLFPPLCLGGVVHVVPEELTTDPAGLGAYFTEHGIDCLKIAPSHFSALLSAPHGERVIPRRLLIVGGEGLKWDLVDRVRELSPGTRVLNHYSPTECTCGVLTYPAGEGPRPETPIAPLGRPLPNSRIYLLDPQMAPVPIGVVGEVHIAGSGVSRGYLGQPDLTRERFLPDPFTPGGRIYRSGDRARYLPDGNIQFLGRVDFQVKIRGYRVELGEIEAALGAHPAVKDVIVLAQDDAFGHKHLVAYVIAAAAAAAGAAELQAHVEALLPEYMVPSTFVLLPGFPLNANGKVDRHALAELAVIEEEGEAHVSPRTPTEEVLAGIWADVFARERVGVHDRFNDLGGHSLVAIQIVARARDAFTAQLPLRAIFEAPTVAQLAAVIDAAARDEAGVARVPPLVRVPRGGLLPLSFAQERLWFLDQLEPGGSAYHIPVRARLHGELDVAALTRALREILRRHEVLRTTYATVDGKPVQVVHEHLAFDLPVEEASDATAVQAAAVAETAQPFDLARGPLVRGRLLRLARDEHVLLLTMHHIVSDAWTKGVLFREMAALYEAFRAGRPSPLDELPLQYADFAVWQRGWLAGEALDRQLSYWKEQLAGAPAALDLPTDRQRPALSSGAGGRRRFELSPELSRAIRALARREGATLFMILLAAFDVLLARTTGQGDVVVGSPVAGRSRPELEPLIGFFVNTLALRTTVALDMPFTELLGLVRETCLAAYAHADVPFERLVADLAPVRDLSRTPIFQVAFTVQDTAAGVLRLPSLALSAVGAENVTSKFDLTLGLGDGPDVIVGSLEYATDLFDAASADRLIEHYRALLGAIVEAPERPVGAHAFLGEAERRALIAWNDTAFPHPTDRLVHEIFEAHAALHPDAVAVTFEGAALRYAELDAHANRLAHALRRLGVGPDTLVGVCMDRSLAMVVSLYGTLKAGGAYVPLDPEYPRDRLAFMLEDARPRVILTQAHVASVLPAHGAQVITLDDTFSAIAHEPASCAGRGDLGLDHLAYVIYTSGSTGRPKGAMNAHRGILNRLLWMQRAHGLSPDDRVLQKTPFSFDVSVWEFFWPLMSGAQLVVAKPGGHKEPAYLAALIQAEAVTTIHFVPSMLKAFVEEPAARRCRSLRRVICSGEALPPDLCDRLFALELGTDLHNLYGPTEAAVDVTAWACAPGAAVVPIGRPIDNVRMYVLDERLALAPVGVPGELYIGGVQVGRGYLNRAELTAERFIDDPFVPGGKLYRTGDLARWLPDGSIEYRGRTDFQVKIRGFRIELGEVEAALAALPAIRDVVVVARGDGADKQLVAYLVAGDAPPTVGELRAALKDRLPEYMIPSAFVPLPSLPLTQSGKVDRRALPPPEAADRLDLGEDFVAPRSAVEEQLSRIWAAVLRLDQVGVHDNFFAIGGDSILSIQIVSRAQSAGIHLTPRQIFQHQTIAELAAVAGSMRLVDAEQGPVVGTVPLTPVQRWRLERLQPQASHDNQSFFLAVREPLDPTAVEGAIAALLEHHDALRLRVDAGLQRFAEPGGPVPLTHVAGGAAIEEAAAEAQRSLDIARGPVLRAVLFDGAAGEGSRLLLVVHHLAVDAVSWRILVEDFWSAYTTLRVGAKPSLPPKTTSYRRWAERLLEHAFSDDLVAESAFWLDERRAAVRSIPVDHLIGENTEASARSITVSLSAEETEALLRRVPEAYRTQINDVLLTAAAQALTGFCGAPTALVDLEGHGREDLFADLDLTRTVGWFTAIFPVLLDPSGAGPGEALKSVKEQLRKIPSRGLGYGLLRYLRSDDLADHLSRLPQAEVSFNYLGQLDTDHAAADAPYTRAREHAGAPHGPENLRRHLLDLHGSVLGGRLHVRFTYSENRHLRATVETLAERFLAALRSLVAHCAAPTTFGYTPADFPRASLAQATLDALAARAPGRGAIEDLHPLSPMQAGLLFHALFDREPGGYYVQLAWTIEGRLDVAAFAAAFQAIVDRHQVLRTAILWEDLDKPLALVHASAALPFVEYDLSSLSPDEQAQEIDRFAADDRRRGFDLARAPLMRVTLLRLGAATWRFLWGSHHIVLDGWSMPMLLKEAFQIYEATVAGREIRVDRAPHYAAFVDWLVARDPARAEAYWKAQLGGFSAPTPLPGEAARQGEHRSGERRLRLSSEQSAALATFARRHQLTMSTLVQGAWALLLSRYSGEDDVVFGSTVSGRSAPVPGIDRMVGLFINTLAVRVRTPPDQSAVAFLAALQAQQAEMREHEHSGLAEVQAYSAVPRGTPLFESLVVFENQPVEDSLKRGAGTLALTEARAVERPPYPLTLQASFRRTLLLRIGHDAARFDGALVERMLGHLTTLLAGIVAHPDARLAALPILTEVEQRRLAAVNDTRFAHPTDRAIHEIFADQAARTPDAVALSFEGRTLTYRELDERANRLAHALARHGVGPEVLVGVCMDRSLEMLVGIYGVLKAGGAYVPLDPEYPRDRLAFMLEDARPRVILCQAHLASVLPEHGASLIRLDADWEAIAAEPATPLGRRAKLDDLAYVIYTSGSTGRPKGAMNEHRGILNRLLWMQHAYGLTTNDRVLQKTPFSFDVSVWELFWPLMFGARLVIARPGGHREPSYLVDTIAAEHITTTHFVPSMLQVFLDEPAASRASSLLRVFASGEALPPALVDRFFARLPTVQLHNLYGPTEAAVDVTSWACHAGAAVVPIGRPVHNTAIYLLDSNLQMVPEGIRGELYIGGVQVGRGYLNRSELTAERFLHDPFVPGSRIYKTGDVARRLPSGDVEYLGRADFQVKLRGFRIELGEIEADLFGHASIREAVVVARDDGGDRRLVAYLVCAEGLRPTAGELRAFLKEKLPEYMVPAAFVLLDHLPLTASGKVDRRALPVPEEGERAGTGMDFAAPTSAIEEELGRIWAAVLRLPKVSVHDNFFEIGGDSILSIQIVARAQRAGIRLTPRQIFEHPTIADLAAVAGTERVAEAEQGLVTGEVPLTPVERWWLDTPRLDEHHWNQSNFVEVHDTIDVAAMARAVARVIEHHDALRLRLVRIDGAVRQTLAPPGGAAPFRVVDLSAVPTDQRRAAIEVAATAAQTSLDLAEGPMLRVVLFSGEMSRLLVVAHHLVVDGISWRVILDDLWTAYDQTVRGLVMALPAKTTSWKRWAERLVTHARETSLDAEAVHWLAAPPAVAARLPVDRREGENDEASARTVLVSLDVQETERLLREVPEAYRTQINDVLLTALAQAFAAWTGAPGALLDFEGHGRDPVFDDVDITRTVGWFTVVYPVAVELPESRELGAAIKSVKEQLRTVPGRGLGYGLLRWLREGDALADALAAQSPAEVLWNYLGQVDQALPDDAPFRWAEGPTGPARSPRAARRYLLDINARVVQGRLHTWFGYSANRHQASTIEALAHGFREALRALIAHCLSAEARGFTPSDFADSSLSQDAIDMLVSEFAEDLDQ